MTAPAPILFEALEDGVLAPAARCRKEAARRFLPGQTYLMEEVQERSEASHAHEFAWLHDAWLNLPEQYAELYPTPEHLRKRALIEGGYFNEEIIDAGSKAAALRVAASLRRREEFSLVIVRDAFVIIRSPKSQSRRAMRKDEFQASKTAIMEVVAGMLGVSAETLARRGA